MTDLNIITIAKKEFIDHVRSRKFLVIFGIILVIAVVGTINGVTSYNNALQSYNAFQKEISQSDAPISDVLQYLGSKPSILLIYNQFSLILLTVGAILGIAMGFDLLSKEKESKSLKVLLSHPVYRDEVINGKALGGITAIILALGIVMVISFSTLLIYGIVPDGSELLLLLIFSIISLIYIFTYFAIALFVSALSDESGTALIYVLIIYIGLSLLIPVMTTTSVISIIAGPAPEMPKILSDPFTSSSGNSSEESSGSPSSLMALYNNPSPELQDYQKKVMEYARKQAAIIDALYLFSPNMNYEKISLTITMPDVAERAFNSPESTMDTGFKSSSGISETSVADILVPVWNNIIALIIFPTVFFGLAYVKFMRMDIR
jgi:ABC-2 type transport system permease protein